MRIPNFIRMPVLIGMSLWAVALGAQTTLDVAYAGSMTAVMNRGLTPAARAQLHLILRGRAQGAYGLARLIAAGSIHPDLFLSITRGPVRILQRAGLAQMIVPVASTELVIAYSPQGPRAARFAALARRARPSPGKALPALLRLLAQPGVRFGRTNPLTDPQGRNIIFALQRAAAAVHDPAIAAAILGPDLNPRQIFPEAEVMARLQAGQLDAASAYKSQPVAMNLPYIPLPAAVNCGAAATASRPATPASQSAEFRRHFFPGFTGDLPAGGVDLVAGCGLKSTRSAPPALYIAGRRFRPAPLVFYAVVLKHASHPRAAEALAHWLASPPARTIWRHYGYGAVPAARS